MEFVYYKASRELLQKKEMIKNRLEELKKANTLEDYENLYLNLATDLGQLNDYLADDIKVIQQRKKQIMEKGVKSMAEFDREFEGTEEYALHKTYKYWSEGLAKMMAGVRVKIDSLRAESKGTY